MAVTFAAEGWGGRRPLRWLLALGALCTSWLVVHAVALGAVGDPCVEQEHCAAAVGEFCLNGTCRGAEETAVEPLFRVAVAPWYDLTPGGGAAGIAAEAAETMRGLLRSTVFFDALDAERAHEEALAEGWHTSTFRFDAWSSRGAFAVVKGIVRPSKGASPYELELHWIETETARRIPFSADVQSVSLSGVRTALQTWLDQVIRHYTGRPGVLSSRIAYSRRSREPGGPKEIFHSSLDGLDEVQVTNNGSINVLPAWAPGHRIAYTSYQAGVPSIYLDEILFASHGSLNTGITWRADGKVAVVAMSGDDGNSDIYLVDGANGALLDRLTHSGGIDTSPAWSPAGDRIAFLSDRSGAPQIWVMNADGSNARSLTPGCGYCTSPDWSPVAPLVVYNAMSGAGRFDIFVVNVDTGHVRRLTNGGGSNEDPSFSPDGRYIVFSSTRGSSRGAEAKQLWVTPVGGGPARRVSRSDALHYTPVWSRRFAGD